MLVKLLIENGAKIVRTHAWMSPLDAAAKSGHYEVVKYLLDIGVVADHVWSFFDEYNIIVTQTLVDNFNDPFVQNVDDDSGEEMEEGMVTRLIENGMI